MPSGSQLKQHRTFSQRGKHDVDTAFVVERNTLMARTRLNGAIYSGPDRAYKAVVNLDTVTVCAALTDHQEGLRCHL